MRLTYCLVFFFHQKDTSLLTTYNITFWHSITSLYYACLRSSWRENPRFLNVAGHVYLFGKSVFICKEVLSILHLILTSFSISSGSIWMPSLKDLDTWKLYFISFWCWYCAFKSITKEKWIQQKDSKLTILPRCWTTSVCCSAKHQIVRVSWGFCFWSWRGKF